MTFAEHLNQTIIVRLPNWIGDVCMSLPSLQALAATGHPLIVCARPWAQGLIRQFKPAQFVSLSGKFTADLAALQSIAKDTRKQSLGLVMPDSLSSAALLWLAGVKSVGYRDDGRSLLLQTAIKKPRLPIHATQKWWLLTQQALLAWGLASDSETTRLQPAPHVGLELDESDHEAAIANIAAKGIAPKSFVLLAPTATGTHHGKIKVWPHFATLAKALKQSNIEVATCPPPNEREQALAACPEATLLDPLPLRQFCALTRLANIVVCNDSGVSHLAAAARATQLTLFGVTDPACTSPWSEQAQWLGTLNQWPSADEVLAKTRQMIRRP